MTTKQLIITASIVVAIVVLSSGADYFRTLRRGLTEWSSVRFGFGVAAGLVLLMTSGLLTWQAPVVVAVAMTIAAAVISTRNHDSDVLEALLTGAMIGGGATLPLLAARRGDLALMAAISGPAATAGMHIATPRRPWIRLLALLVSASAAIVAATAGSYLIGEWEPVVMIPLALALPPLAAMIFTLARWPVAIRELRDEATLGFVDATEVASMTHPFRRLRLAVWRDREARRRFVQLATELSVRKNRQRSMSSQRARLHQLEIMKLRMQLKEIESIELSLAAAANPTYPSGEHADPNLESDDVQTKG